MTSTANIPNALRALADHLDQHPLAGEPERVVSGIRPHPLDSDIEVNFFDYNAAVAFAATLADPTVEAAHFGPETTGRAYWSIRITGTLNDLTVAAIVYPDEQPGETEDTVKAAVTQALQAHQ